MEKKYSENTIVKDYKNCSYYKMRFCKADKKQKLCDYVSIYKCKALIEKYKKFYLVWDATTGIADKQHVTKEAAQKEARRLAELNTDQMFCVLSCEEGYIQESKPVQKVLF